MMDEYQQAYAPQNAAAGFMDPVFRDALDAKRSAFRRTPESEYPAGYLGTIRSRRQDRLLTEAGRQLNRKAYDRGVHKGERLGQADYYWPPEFGPLSGLQAQARGIRQVPLGTEHEYRLINDGKQMTPGEKILDPARADALSSLRPRWHS